MYLAAIRFHYIKAEVPNTFLFVIRYLYEISNSDDRNSKAKVDKREKKDT